MASAETLAGSPFRELPASLNLADNLPLPLGEYHPSVGRYAQMVDRLSTFYPLDMRQRWALFCHYTFCQGTGNPNVTPPNLVETGKLLEVHPSYVRQARDRVLKDDYLVGAWVLLDRLHEGSTRKGDIMTRLLIEQALRDPGCGKTNTELAREFGVHRRTVQTVASKMEELAV